MKTSYNETREIEKYLTGAFNAGEALAFRARMLLDKGLKEKVRWQQEAYQAVKLYGRNSIKRELDQAFDQLIKKPVFRHQLMEIFKR